MQTCRLHASKHGGSSSKHSSSKHGSSSKSSSDRKRHRSDSGTPHKRSPIHLGKQFVGLTKAHGLTSSEYEAGDGQLSNS